MKAATLRRGELLGPVLQRYFCDYLINQRRLSDCTVAAYRDTFKLLLAFLERKRGLKPDDLRVQSIDADSVLAFLDDLERTRRNCCKRCKIPVLEGHRVIWQAAPTARGPAQRAGVPPRSPRATAARGSSADRAPARVRRDRGEHA